MHIDIQRDAVASVQLLLFPMIVILFFDPRFQDSRRSAFPRKLFLGLLLYLALETQVLILYELALVSTISYGLLQLCCWLVIYLLYFCNFCFETTSFFKMCSLSTSSSSFLEFKMTKKVPVTEKKIFILFY